MGMSTGSHFRFLVFVCMVLCFFVFFLVYLLFHFYLSSFPSNRQVKAVLCLFMSSKQTAISSYPRFLTLLNYVLFFEV